MGTKAPVRRRIAHLAVAVVVALPIALAAAAGPAAAGQVCQGNAANAPDGRIKLGTGVFQGIGTYPVTTSPTFLPPGGSATWKLRWKNLTANNRNIAVQLHSVVGGSNFKIRYSVGGNDVTQLLKSGQTLKYPSTPPSGSTPTLEVVITRKSADAGGVIVRLRGYYYLALPRPPCDGLFPTANVSL